MFLVSHWLWEQIHKFPEQQNVTFFKHYEKISENVASTGNAYFRLQGGYENVLGVINALRLFRHVLITSLNVSKTLLASLGLTLLKHR
jgi:hypothetical protein